MPGVRRSACITAVMVLPAATAGCGNRAEAARTGNARLNAMLGSFRREKWNILTSPDVKAVNRRSRIMHEVRYLGELTRCKLFQIRDLHQARCASIRIWSMPDLRLPSRIQLFTNSLRIILVSAP